MNYMDKPGCPFPRQAQRTAKPQYYFELRRKEKAQTSELEKASSSRTGSNASNCLTWWTRRWVGRKRSESEDIYPCTPKAKENAYSKALKRRAGSVRVDINKYCRRLWPYLEYEKARNETCLLNRGPAWKSPHIRWRKYADMSKGNQWYPMLFISQRMREFHLSFHIPIFLTPFRRLQM